MKKFKKTKFISLALVALLAFSSCESSKAGDKSDQNNYLLANLLNQNGGNVLGESMTIENFGIYVSFLDTEGNRNSVIQPQGM